MASVSLKISVVVMGMCCSSDRGPSMDLGSVNLWYHLLENPLGKRFMLLFS